MRQPIEEGRVTGHIPQYASFGLQMKWCQRVESNH